MSSKLPEREFLIRGLGFFLLQIANTNMQFNSVLLESKGIDKTALGVLLMTGTASGLISPFILSYLASAMGGARNLLALLAVVMGSCMISLPHLDSLLTIYPVFFVFSASMGSAYAMMSAFAQETTEARGFGSYYKLRSMGSSGFVTGCLLSWWLVDRIGYTYMYVVLGVPAILCAFIVLLANPLQSKLNGGHKDKSFKAYWSAIKLLWKPKTVFILAAYSLLQLAFMATLAMQGNYILHYFSDAKATISISWVLSSLPEVPILLLFNRVMKRYGLRKVLMIGFGAMAFKITGMALAQELWHLYAVLIIHGVYIAGASTGVEIYIKRTYSDHAHILLPLCLGLVMTMPRMVGSLAGGFIWEHFGLRAVFGVAGAFTCILFMTLVFCGPWLKRQGVE